MKWESGARRWFGFNFLFFFGSMVWLKKLNSLTYISVLETGHGNQKYDMQMRKMEIWRKKGSFTFFRHEPFDTQGRFIQLITVDKIGVLASWGLNLEHLCSCATVFPVLFFIKIIVEATA